MYVKEIDWRSPFDAFAPLAGEAYTHLLHGGDLSVSAEWSLIAAFPSTIIETGAAPGNPFSRIGAVLGERSVRRDPAQRAFPFISGVLGFAGYEAARHFEKKLNLPSSPFALPEISFGVYDAVALFSRRKNRGYVAGRDSAACGRLERALGKRGSFKTIQPARFNAARSNFSSSEFKAAVSEVIENILEGDYYQANLSHQITADAANPVDALSLFKRLAAGSDAFFGALLQFPDGAVISNSPERFFRISPGPGERRRIVAEPIKGTRRRGGSPSQDRLLAAELLSDRKDRAENIMIADLLRNDLSRICEEGTIREEAVCELLSLANVHHLVSRISGELRSDASIGDIFSALFPCGSVTGAPKIEAMKAIARLERTGRGPYCGAIGYIDDCGAADFSVAIRTLIAEKERLVAPVGGGVTLRSDPAGEYEETLVKATGALQALGLSADALS